MGSYNFLIYLFISLTINVGGKYIKKDSLKENINKLNDEIEQLYDVLNNIPGKRLLLKELDDLDASHNDHSVMEELEKINGPVEGLEQIDIMENPPGEKLETVNHAEHDTFEEIEHVNEKSEEDLYEGDIKESDHPSTEEGNDKRNAVRNPRLIWHSRDIPYLFDTGLADLKKKTVLDAMAFISNNSCITFREKTATDTHYIQIISQGGCWSHVGRQLFSPNRLSIGDGCEYLGIAMHELLHALGFFHEQSRYDRDQFVEIKWENIYPGRENNFRKLSVPQSRNLNTGYDYGSIMHYSKYSFSTNGQPTIEVPGKPDASLGQRKELSPEDIVSLKRLYHCTNTNSLGQVEWTQWSSYGICHLLSTNKDDPCYKARYRFCSTKDACKCDTSATGDICYEQVEECTDLECKLDGHWGHWGSWSSCTSDNYCEKGTKTRERKCDNPEPRKGGKSCDGVNQEAIVCEGICPRECTFDDNFCGYTKKGLWVLTSGGTPSWNTGPALDANGTSTGQYIYTEVTRQPPYTTSTLESVSFHPTGGKQCFSMNYHMYGSHMGNLTVYVKNDASRTQLWTVSGDQGKYWKEVKFDLESKVEFTIYIESVSGPSYQSDVAVDNIFLKESPCDKVVPTQPPVPTTQPPVPTTQPPVPTTQPPVPTTQPPVPTTQPPVPTTQPPVPTTQPPVPTTQPPVPTTQPPVPTTQPPVPTTQTPLPPVPPTQPPIPPTQPPAPPTQPPVSPTQPPVPPTQPPVPPTQPPVPLTQPPVPPTQPPVPPTQPPVPPTQPPVPSTQPPVPPTQPPVPPTQPPVPPTQPPVPPTQPPVPPTQPPVKTTKPPVPRVTTSRPITAKPSPPDPGTISTLLDLSHSFDEGNMGGMKIMNPYPTKPGTYPLSRWTALNHGYRFNYTEPIQDRVQEGGYYLAVHGERPTDVGKSCMVRSPNFKGDGSQWIEFYYYMWNDKLPLGSYSEKMGMLEVSLVRENSLPVVLYSTTKAHNGAWEYGRVNVDVPSSEKFYLKFMAILGRSRSTIAIDDLKGLPGTFIPPSTPLSKEQIYSPSALSCSFSASVNSTCFWRLAGDFKWTTHNGTTTSFFTGPNYPGAVTGDVEHRYIYAEASEPQKQDDVATMRSALIFTSEPACMVFYASMYGSQIGSLKVETIVRRADGLQDKTEKDITASSWSAAWNVHRLQLPIGKIFQVQLNATIGFGPEGDIAIDNIVAVPGICTVPSTDVKDICGFDDIKQCEANGVSGRDFKVVKDTPGDNHYFKAKAPGFFHLRILLKNVDQSGGCLRFDYRVKTTNNTLAKLWMSVETSNGHAILSKEYKAAPEGTLWQPFEGNIPPRARKENITVEFNGHFGHSMGGIQEIDVDNISKASAMCNDYGTVSSPRVSSPRKPPLGKSPPILPPL